MKGYESIPEGLLQGVNNAQDVREEGSEMTSVGGLEGREQVSQKRRRKLAVVSLAVLSGLGVLLGLSGAQRSNRDHFAHEQEQDEFATADPGSKHYKHAPISPAVFETSMYTGARLDQGFPSPAGLKAECSRSSSSGTDDYSSDSSDSDSDDDDDDDDDDDESSSEDHDHSAGGDDEGVLCPGRGWGTVVVESKEKLQTIIGFGGAFTDAATINFYRLPVEVQTKVMDAYFGPSGIEYSVGRIPMGSCDFSVQQYSFDEVPGDYNLTYFDDGVEKDTVQRIPMLLEALEREGDLKLFTSPWSPPAWMKVPIDGIQSMIESAEPQGLIDDPRVHAAWALFFSKFITAYKEQGVDLWGLTIQNESENPGPWEACVYTPTSQANFIRDFLGPVIRRDHPDVKIMAFDHNRDHLMKWTEAMMSDEETSQYVDGMAFHWYFGGMERWLDGSIGWNALDRAQQTLGGDKFILSTESCNCPFVEHSIEGGWRRAEHMAHDMIADVNHWSTGWVDWNLLLDYDGGPNHAGNLCDSPIICDKNHTDVIFQPMYYFMGHMSKFAKPGARRLASHVTGSYQAGGMGPSTTNAGYEATVYGCEGSVRQSWELSATGLITLADYYGAEFDWFVPMCMSKTVSESTQAVNMVPCDSDQAGVFTHDPETGHLVLHPNASYPPDAYPPVIPETGVAGPGEGEGGVAALSSSTPAASAAQPEAAKCLDVLNGSVEDGAVLTLTNCPSEEEIGSSSSQQWEFSSVEGGAGEGSLISGATGQCVTAGWPFFTGAAFEMSEESKDRHGRDYAVVLLNEAEEPVEFDLSFPSEGFTVRAMIGPRSIQTILV